MGPSLSRIPVSIPQSGLQAFRPASSTTARTSLASFQSLNRAYKRSDNRHYPRHRGNERRFNPSIGLTSVPTYKGSRAYKVETVVSIPQSGLQAFRRYSATIRDRRAISFNPSIGLTSVPTSEKVASGLLTLKFQSLNRAYKRSDGLELYQGKPLDTFQSLNRAYKRSDSGREYGAGATCTVSIPQSGLQAFRLIYLLMEIMLLGCFNPSIGLTSVPTHHA